VYVLLVACTDESYHGASNYNDCALKEGSGTTSPEKKPFPRIGEQRKFQNILGP